MHKSLMNDHLPPSSVEFMSNDLIVLVEETLALERPAAATAGVPGVATAGAVPGVLPPSPVPPPPAWIPATDD